MLDVKRYNEIKMMTVAERLALADTLQMDGWTDSHKVSIISLMAREFELSQPVGYADESARLLRTGRYWQPD